MSSSSSESSSSSDESEKRKKAKREKKHKKEKKKKHKKEKKKKHKKEKKLRDSDDEVDKLHEAVLTNQQWAPFGEIKASDLYTKANEFHAWLMEVKKVSREKMTGREEKQYFEEFMEVGWF